MAGINGEYLKQFAADLTTAERNSSIAFDKWRSWTFVIYNDLTGLYIMDCIPDKGERFTLVTGNKLEILKAMQALMAIFKKLED